MPALYDYPGGYRMKFEGEATVSKSGSEFHSFDYSAGAKTLTLHRLKLSSTSSSGLLAWLRTATPSGGEPKTLLIEGLSRSGTPIARWTVRHARPTRYTPISRSSKNEVAIETLEIVHEGFQD
ncbi:MAG: phage tail protein [Bryobacterales bacterium]|nr:phage tail protein [Bryobacterales bacterium]